MALVTDRTLLLHRIHVIMAGGEMTHTLIYDNFVERREWLSDDNVRPSLDETRSLWTDIKNQLADARHFTSQVDWRGEWRYKAIVPLMRQRERATAWERVLRDDL